MTTESYDNLIARLIKESNTFAEDKKRRARQTRHSILVTKLTTSRRKLILGSLHRHHREAQITVLVCGECGGETEVVDHVHVWSHSPHKGVDNKELTYDNIHTAKGMYSLHKDIPLKVFRTRTWVAICAKCLDAEAFFNV